MQGKLRNPAETEYNIQTREAEKYFIPLPKKGMLREVQQVQLSGITAGLVTTQSSILQGTGHVPASQSARCELRAQDLVESIPYSL